MLLTVKASTCSKFWKVVLSLPRYTVFQAVPANWRLKVKPLISRLGNVVLRLPRNTEFKAVPAVLHLGIESLISRFWKAVILLPRYTAFQAVPANCRLTVGKFHQCFILLEDFSRGT